MVVVRLDSLCVTPRVSMYACMVMCNGSSLNWGVGWNTMVRCHGLSVSCNSSSLDVDWGVLDFKLVIWFLSSWNCSIKPAKGCQVSKFLHNICQMNHCLTLALGGPMMWDPRKPSPGCQGCPLCSDFHILSLCHVFCSTFQRCLAAFRCDCLQSQDMWMLAVAVQVIEGKSQLPGDGCDKHGCLLYRWGSSQSGVGEIQFLTGVWFICLLIGIFDCELSYDGTSVKVQNCCFPSVKIQNDHCTSLGVQGVRSLLMHLVCWPRFSL